MSTNIYYIRAAIQENTGIRVELEDLRRILVEERMISKSTAKNIIFRGYKDFFDRKDYSTPTESPEEKYTLVDLFEEPVLEEEQEEERVS